MNICLLSHNKKKRIELPKNCKLKILVQEINNQITNPNTEYKLWRYIWNNGRREKIPIPFIYDLSLYELGINQRELIEIDGNVSFLESDIIPKPKINLGQQVSLSQYQQKWEKLRIRLDNSWESKIETVIVYPNNEIVDCLQTDFPSLRYMSRITHSPSIIFGRLANNIIETFCVIPSNTSIPTGDILGSIVGCAFIKNQDIENPIDNQILIESAQILKQNKCNTEEFIILVICQNPDNQLSISTYQMTPKFIELFEMDILQINSDESNLITSSETIEVFQKNKKDNLTQIPIELFYIPKAIMSG